MQNFVCTSPTSWNLYDRLLYLPLSAFTCYRPSEPVNGPPAEAVNIFETFTAATRGYKFSCLSGFSIADSFILSSYIFTIPFSLFVHEFTFVEMLPFFYLFFFGFNCIHTPAI